jgi:hypothetical protein
VQTILRVFSNNSETSQIIIEYNRISYMYLSSNLNNYFDLSQMVLSLLNFFVDDPVSLSQMIPNLLRGSTFRSSVVIREKIGISVYRCQVVSR